MASYPPEPKRFDAVTVFGLIFAVALLFYGMYAQNQKRDALLKQQQKEAVEKQEKEEAVKWAQDHPAPTNVVNPPPDAPKKAAETPDIPVTTESLELTFCSKGAALKKAHLLGVDTCKSGIEKGAKDAGIYEDPYKKGAEKAPKGLDILDEIVDGKRAFGLPVVEIKIKDGASLILDGKKGNAESLDEGVWSIKDSGEEFKTSGGFNPDGIRTLAYSYPIQNYLIVKTFTIYKSERFVKCDVTVKNNSDKDVTYFYHINGPQGILLDGPRDDPKGNNGARVYIQAQLAARPSAAQGQSNAEPDTLTVTPDAAKAETDENRSLSKAENLWGVLKNRFFIASFVSLDPRQLLKIVAEPIQNAARTDDPRFTEPNIGLQGYRAWTELHKTDGMQTDSYAMYLGPADDRRLEAAEAAMKPLMTTPSDYHLTLSIQYLEWSIWRWLYIDRIALGMMWLFRGLYNLFHSFGLAVVLMTIIIKLCLHPLQRRGMISMSKLQKIQPELNKIKEKYKNATSNEAKMKMMTEQNDLMKKKSGANPAGGCLPMFIQIPVFSALYGIFNHAYDMRGAEFLWIRDLSQADRILPLPFWPNAINLLPILYSVLSIVQTRFTPQQKSDDPQQEMNRKMFQWMPLVFSLMFYRMPAGMVLYFAVSACWGMLESWYIKTFVIKDAKPVATTTSKPAPAIAK